MRGAKGGIILALGRIASKVIGLFRERLISVYFGSSYVADTFRLLLSIVGLIMGTFINPLQRYGISLAAEGIGGKNRGKTLRTLEVLAILSTVMALIVGSGMALLSRELAILFMPFLRDNPQAADVAAGMMALGGLLIITQSALVLLENIAMLLRLYTVVGIRDPAVNIIQTGLLAIIPTPLILVGGRVIGMALFILVLGYILYRRYGTSSITAEGSRRRLALDIIQGSLPLMAGSSIVMLNQFVDRAMAGYLGEGNIALMGYAATISGLIGGLVIDPFVRASLPRISEHIRGGKWERFQREAGEVFETALFFALPMYVGIAALGNRIAYFFFGGSKLGPDDIALIGLLAGIMGISQLLAIASIYTNAIIPLGKTYISMVTSSVVVPVNIALNYLLAFVLGMGVVGLKVASVIASLLGLLTAIYLIKKITHRPFGIHLIIPGSIKTALSSALMLAAIFPVRNFKATSRLYTILVILLGAAVYFTAQWLIGHPVMEKIKTKLSKLFE